MSQLRRRYDPLTYRHPRTIEEAFAPSPVEYACSVTKYTNVGLKFVSWIVRFGWMILFLCVLALISDGYQS